MIKLRDEKHPVGHGHEVPKEDVLVVSDRLCDSPGLDIVGAWKYPLRSEEDG